MSQRRRKATKTIAKAECQLAKEEEKATAKAIVKRDAAIVDVDEPEDEDLFGVVVMDVYHMQYYAYCYCRCSRKAADATRSNR